MRKRERRYELNLPSSSGLQLLPQTLFIHLPTEVRPGWIKKHRLLIFRYGEGEIKSSLSHRPTITTANTLFVYLRTKAPPRLVKIQTILIFFHDKGKERGRALIKHSLSYKSAIITAAVIFLVYLFSPIAAPFVEYRCKL